MLKHSVTSEVSTSKHSTVTALLQRSQSCHSNLLTKTVQQDQYIENVNNKGEIKSVPSIVSASSDRELNNNEEMKSSVNMDDHNRTMVLQVDRTDLRLISPDRKVILLHKHHRDVTTCVQVRRYFLYDIFEICFKISIFSVILYLMFLGYRIACLYPFGHSYFFKLFKIT